MEFYQTGAFQRMFLTNKHNKKNYYLIAFSYVIIVGLFQDEKENIIMILMIYE